MQCLCGRQFPQTVNLRVDYVNDQHVHCSLFMNGVNCGKLIFRTGEYQIFTAAIGLGCKQTNGHLIDKSDEEIFLKYYEIKE